MTQPSHHFAGLALAALCAASLAACGSAAPIIEAPSAGQMPALTLPPVLDGKATVLTPADPDYGKAAVADAIKPAGQGGISAALVIRVDADVPVYRMWNGPDKKNEQGLTNRMGQWWGYDTLGGPVDTYRRDYDICHGWNDLTWVATCTLKAGSVVAIGPGQSVSADACGDPTGKESYPANPDHWQVWVAKAWSRGDELACPPESEDYRADPADISKPMPPQP